MKFISNLGYIYIDSARLRSILRHTGGLKRHCTSSAIHHNHIFFNLLLLVGSLLWGPKFFAFMVLNQHLAEMSRVCSKAQDLMTCVRPISLCSSFTTL